MPERDQKIQFDKELLAVYLTGLQAEVEAKLRAVTRFRENMQRLDGSGGVVSRDQRVEAARSLINQVEQMLDTNRIVREMLEDIKSAAQAVIADMERQD